MALSKIIQDSIADDAVTAAKIGSLPAGSVLQVVYGTTTTQANGGSSNGSYFDAGLSASITPSSASNKIIVLVSLRLFTQPNCVGIARILRDNTTAIHGIARYGLTDETSTGDGNYYVVTELDSPNTTNQVAYKAQVGRQGGSNDWYVQLDADRSSMILMEIAG